MSKSFKPTEAMKNNARRGLALREKYGRGGLSTSEAGKEGIGSGVARARDISNGSLSLESVKKMYAFFSRHEKNYKPKERESDGGPTAGTIAWLLWGGSAGFAWSRKILKEQEILKSYKKDIQDSEINTEENLKGFSQQITKSVNEDLMQATYVVLVPDDVDLHGDTYSEEEVRKACHNFNNHCMKANLFHLVETDGFVIAESYIAPTDFILDEVFVKKGTWLATLQYLDEDLWEGVKNGDIQGVSIGAVANVEMLDDSEE